MAAEIVPFDERHAAEVLALIGDVFAEYAMTFEPAGFDADLTAIGAYYLDRGGTFAVLVDAGRVVGSVGAVHRAAGECELKRLYLRPAYRGRGHGARLVSYVLDWAAGAGCRAVVLWSDVRLDRAHGVYERMGFARFGERAIEDADRSREIGFRYTIDGA